MGRKLQTHFLRVALDIFYFSMFRWAMLQKCPVVWPVRLEREEGDHVVVFINSDTAE